jgi:hypothetical protein
MSFARKRYDLAVTGIVCLCCALAGGLVVAGVATPIRATTTLVALTLGTGLSITGWISWREKALFWAVTFGVGIATSLLVSLLAVEIAWWHPVGTVTGLLALSVASLVLQMLSRAVPSVTNS